MKKIVLLLPIVFLFLSGCGPDYNTDFEPPPPNAKLDDVFPNEIAGLKREVKRMQLEHPMEGFTSSYGNGKITIDAILTQGKSDADDYFKNSIAPGYDKMKNHFRGNINGKWSASGTDENGKKWFAWVNNRWIFQISGADKDYLMKAVDAFKYVAE